MPSNQSTSAAKAYTPIRMPMAVRTTMLFTVLNGLSQRLFYWPSVFQSPEKNLTGNPGFRGPIRKWLRSSIPCQTKTIAPIPRLLCLCGPAHVSGLVIASGVWVAIKRVTNGWARPNVSQKRREVATPRFNDRHAARAVVLESWIARVQASLLNAFPDRVLGCVLESVFSQERARNLLMKTATTARHAALQVRARGVRAASAVTDAIPSDLLSGVGLASTKHEQSPESLAAQVDHLHDTDFNTGIPQYRAVMVWR